MNGRFINDVIDYKCKDGKKRRAMIINDYNNGWFDVAYVKSNGSKNVEVHIEEYVYEDKLLGESVQVDTILPYNIGDLVAYYLDPNTYYLAHIVEVGPYNTIKILLGDLYMDRWIKDKKRGDYLEVDVKNIRWDGSADSASKKTKIRYGYEPQELHNANWFKKQAQGVFKFVGVCALFAAMVYSGIKITGYLSEQSNQLDNTTEYRSAVIEKTTLSNEEKNAYMPIERIFAEIYEKSVEDITDEEKNAITFLKVNESQRFTSTEYSYYIDYTINGGEVSRIDFVTTEGIDSYNFSMFSGVTELVLDMDDLKTIDFISSMPQVKKLDVDHTSVSDISVLAETAIEELNLNKNKEITDYSVLSHMSGLKKLIIDCDDSKLDTVTDDLMGLEELTTDTVSFVGKCPNLKKLTISYWSTCSFAVDYTIIVNCTSIEELSIINGNIDESALDLFAMENLKSLSLDGCVMRIQPGSVPDNDKLTSLFVSNIIFIENYSETSDGFMYYIDYDEVELADHMDFFKHFSKLKDLTVVNQKLKDISTLSNLNELETIDLSGNSITDFNPILDLPKLKKVTIKDNPFNENPSLINFGEGVEVIY